MSDPDTPQSANTGGEPGTVAVTVPPKSQQTATYKHEPAAETPKLRVANAVCLVSG